MQVNLQYAEEYFADLAAAVDSGQVVEIARADKPMLKLVVSQVPASKRATPRILGTGMGMLRIPSREEWRAMHSPRAQS
jgi:antitoxin (DNA-binding transcriptional repressor) of toxin-antitoxin stability system